MNKVSSALLTFIFGAENSVVKLSLKLWCTLKQNWSFFRILIANILWLKGYEIRNKYFNEHLMLLLEWDGLSWSLVIHFKACLSTIGATLRFWLLMQGILKWEVSLYHWHLVWLVWNQLYEYWQFLFLLAKQANRNQSNRSTTVQWFFPL